MDVYRKHAAACTSHSPTSQHDYVLAKLERSVRAVLGSKHEVVVAHAMNALFKRAADVEKAKIADLRVRIKQVPGGVPTDLWVDMVNHAPGGRRAPQQLLHAAPGRRRAEERRVAGGHAGGGAEGEAVHQDLPVHAGDVILRVRAGHVRRVG
jgi:hypothetical protein